MAKARLLGESQSDEGPVLILDHYDNTASGGTMDTTNVLAEGIVQGLDDVAFCGIYDPDAVKVMQDAGGGNEVSLLLGESSQCQLCSARVIPLT